MKLALHVALFLVVAIAIVAMGAFYSEADDRRALRSVPRRLLVFLFGCAVLVAIMLLLEHTVASVD